MSDFVGYCPLEVVDAAWDLAFPLAVLYPTRTPGRPETVDRYPLDVALRAPVAAGRFPLVLVSHGTGGSPWAYRTLAHYLARHGFVVGLPEHPRNNRHDNAWAGTARNLAARPRHLHLAIDCLFQHPTFAAALWPDAVGLVGHSLGGYSALALAGGQPRAVAPGPPPGPPQPVPTVADGRVRALVLLAPATPWFRGPEALRGVRVPVLLFGAAKDEHTPAEHAQLVLDGVADPSQVDYRVVENAGYFAFLSPFPASMTSPAFPPSQDPPGFDRVRFHDELNAQVRAFLARHL